MESSPEPLCQCGCGEPVGYYPRSNGTQRKGEPRKFLTGHHRRKSPVQYVEDENGCWIWQGHILNSGYGSGWFNKRRMTAHRGYYEAAVGPIPEGMDIDHLCNVKLCVNPAHLEAVTRAENIRRKSSTILTARDAAYIKRSRERAKDLAARFGISHHQVNSIRCGKKWRDV